MANPTKGKMGKVELGEPGKEGCYLQVMMLDVPPEMEADFNRVYDTDHASRLSVVPGVRSVARFQMESSSRTENMPRFMAIYVLDSPEVMETKEWQDAAAAGDWRPLIRPHTFNRESHVWRLMKTTKT